MTDALPPTTRRLLSTVTPEGRLELSLVEAPVKAPKAGEVLIAVQASPINPSDLGLLLGPADMATLRREGDKVVADIPERLRPLMAARAGQAMPVGNEGAGKVIAAGPDAASQALIGRTVATFGGAMYARHRIAATDAVLPLPEGTDPADGASCFVNPLTALGMVETMRLEGHSALIHTAAASNLGQMLNKICRADGVELVNIVRSAEQAKILTDIGARHVVDSSAPDFMKALVGAVTETGATLAFDATGGGTLANQILTAMEAAQGAIDRAKGGAYSRYGSMTHKQVYLYGGLNTAPTELTRTYGMAWGVGGWLLTLFLNRVGPQRADALRARVVAELKTTFASHYTREIGLEDLMDPEVLAACQAKRTGEKFLIRPDRG